MRSVGSIRKINHRKTRAGLRQNPTGKKPRKLSPSNDLLTRPIRDYASYGRSNMTELVERMMNSGGFEAVNLANGIEILKVYEQRRKLRKVHLLCRFNYFNRYQGNYT